MAIVRRGDDRSQNELKKKKGNGPNYGVNRREANSSFGRRKALVCNAITAASNERENSRSENLGMV